MIYSVVIVSGIAGYIYYIVIAMATNIMFQFISMIFELVSRAVKSLKIHLKRPNMQNTLNPTLHKGQRSQQHNPFFNWSFDGRFSKNDLVHLDLDGGWRTFIHKVASSSLDIKKHVGSVEQRRVSSGIFRENT